MSIRNVFILVFNDLALALKNKTLFLIFFIPVFIFVSLALLDSPDADKGAIKIGLIKNQPYTPKILQSIHAAETWVEVTWLESEAYGISLLKEHKIDGVLTQHTTDSLQLMVLKKESIHTLAIMETFSSLQKAAEGSHENWITNIQSIYEGGIQRQTLPTWILMLILLVGLVILPAQVAEEKEKKLLLALLQTPMHEMEWLTAKLITGMLLVITAVLLLHLLGEFGPIHYVDYIAFVIAGSFCFSACGIFLGFLCRQQASARTLGLIFYIPLLLPSALSDVSQKLSGISPFLPSYPLYMPLQSILLEDGKLASFFLEWICLLLLGSLMVYLSYLLMKKRWLM